MTSPAGARPSAPRVRLIVAAILTAVAVAARWRTFGNPVLGFDEQFYLLVGARMWHGAVPYVDIFDRKPIGLFLIYALAAAPGLDAFVAYKLLALGSVVATALLICGMARRIASPRSALIAAILYVLWLNFMEGDGGQSPVFYDLPMVAAASVLLGIDRPAALRRRGAVAMALIGIALQIKYSVVVEGVWFGLWLIARGVGARQRWGAIVLSTLCWVGAALLPTLLAYAWYAAMGQGSAFVFANFLSVLSQGQPSAGQASGALVIAGILLPLAIAATVRWRVVPAPDRCFLTAWLAVAVLSVALYGRFASPHYAIPILLPLTVLAAPAFDAGTRGSWAAVALAGIGFVGGQLVLAVSEATKGGADQAAAVASAAQVGSSCLYVYDGYPALYLLTRSCLPTRWIFPGHLSTADEASAAALGVDPVAEVRRIMAARPDAVVDDFPVFAGGNPATRRVLQAALDSDYRLSACIPTGPHRVRLVYRRRGDGTPNPRNCPPPSALRPR